MNRIKVLFLIHDLMGGGAENVLVNLVNNMDTEKFDITVEAILGGGVNERRLKSDIRYISAFPCRIPKNCDIMRCFSPETLHRFFIRERYDIEVAYIEGSVTRVIAGGTDSSVKRHAWVHCTPKTAESLGFAFKSLSEAANCYNRFDGIHCVSQTVRDLFMRCYPEAPCPDVLYNTIETAAILQKKNEPVEAGLFREGEIRLCAVGKLTKLKGFDRLARVHKALRKNGYPVHTYILGRGEEKENLEQWAAANGIADSFTLLGYQTNPYKYMSRCDVFVCSSMSEGFSTAATEALIVGNAVCTVEVSGMKEMLGEHNEYGIITENTEEALFKGLETLLHNPSQLEYYKHQARLRGKTFSTEETVRAVENMLMRGISNE